LKGVTCSRTWASFSPPTARKWCPTATLRWLLTTKDKFLAHKIAQKPCIFSCIILYMMFLKYSKLFRKFTMSDNLFRGTALGIGRSKVVPCGDHAAAYILWELQASRQRPVTVEKSGSRAGVGNDRTGAQLPSHDLQFPCRAAQQRRPACTQTAIY
jgi:hypothetical protein